MAAPKIGIYAGDPLNPERIRTEGDRIKAAGWTTIIVSLFHVSDTRQNLPDGSMIYFNDIPIITLGQPATPYKGWNKALLQLKENSSIEKIYLSFGGGPPVRDFQTIRDIYNVNNTFDATMLKRNLEALRDLLPDIDGIDMDCEETYERASFVAFCKLMDSLGYRLTFAPYQEQKFWIDALIDLQSLPGVVERINLQLGAYDPQDWVTQFKSAGFDTTNFFLSGDLSAYYDPHPDGLPPGWYGSCPSTVTENLISRRKNIETSIAGGFIWNLDNILNPDWTKEHGFGCGGTQFRTMEEYVSAITAGMVQGAAVT